MLPTGITTAALLKSQLDRGSDYFELLTPFVEQAVSAQKSDVVAPEALRESISRLYGLHIALRTVVSLMDRLAKRPSSCIRKEGVAFMRAEPVAATKDGAQELMEQFSQLGESFRQFCTERLPSVGTGAEALSLIVTFLEANSATLVLDGSSAAKSGRREDIAVARFVTESLRGDSMNGRAILSLLQGLVLARAVTLEDLSVVERKLTDLRVYFDTSFALSAAGLYGPTDLEAARDAVRVLRELGAVPAVFDATVAEVKRILSVYEDRLDTTEGRAGLYQTPLKTYFLAINARGTDARTASELLERTLADEGIVIHATPQRQNEFVADEQGLAEALRDFRGSGHEAREKHDVDCIAAVLTIRRGRPAARLEDARAVFSAAGMVVRTTGRWWQTSGISGLAPIIDHAALLNYCWIKRPTVAPRLHRHELAALCAATLAPSEDAWNAFKTELKKFAADGRISSAEAAVILIDSFSQKLLVEAEATETITPGSAATIVDRVRAELRREVAAAQEETLREREAFAAAVRTAQVEKDGALTLQEGIFSQKLDEMGLDLSLERTRREQLEASVAGLSRVLARLVSVPLASILVALTVAAVVFPFVRASALPQWAQVTIQVVAVTLGIAGGAFGISAFSIGQRFHGWLELRIKKALLRGDVARPAQSDPPSPEP